MNPADGTYLNEFRIYEGVDTSYTKFNRKPDPMDNNPFDKVVPPADLPYVGWTEPGEWFNITVDAARSGTYAADFLYTSNRGGTISVDVSGKDATGPLEAPAHLRTCLRSLRAIWAARFGGNFEACSGPARPIAKPPVVSAIS